MGPLKNKQSRPYEERMNYKGEIPSKMLVQKVYNNNNNNKNITKKEEGENIWLNNHNYDNNSGSYMQ